MLNNLVGVLMLTLVLLTGCTLSFQNISTHGIATDLVDDNLAATADVKPVINTPVPAVL